MKKKLKIAFYMLGDSKWPLGFVFLKDLFSVLHDTCGTAIKFSLLLEDASRGGVGNVHEHVDEVLLVPTPPTTRRLTLSWLVNGIMRRVFPRVGKMKNRIRMERFLKQHGVDVLFGPVIQTQYRGVPTLSWLWDFQHVHLPEMFSTQGRLERNQRFLQTAKVATRIILISESVRKDFCSFMPKYADKARIVKPVSYIPTSVYENNPKSITYLYHLPDKFVYLPNQFWKHKNHELAFRALKILKDKGTKVFLVCTGYQDDYRHPDYFVSLLQKLSKWDIQGQVAFLGLLPWEHVLMLMRQSVCVMNPSLFEGFSLTMDEARSVGKQVLLSDIPPHREQDIPKAAFFNPYNCEELAEKLSTIWHEALPGPDPELEEKARKELPGRIAEFARSFVSVVNEVTQ